MENEIKVNEYVRLQNGVIGTIIEIKTVSTNMRGEHAYAYKLGKTKKYNSCWVEDYAIVKHSPELLDLIKAEDTIKIKIGLYTSFVHFIVDEDDLTSIKAQIEANFWIIDKIYTKEMMESISYKVKE